MQSSTVDNQKRTGKQNFLNQLKTIIETAYKDGVDKIVRWKIEDDSIVGQFQDGAKLFDFVLTESKVKYKPSQLKIDSLYPQMEGKNSIYKETYLNTLFREDKKTKAQCTAATSYSCGSSCINIEKNCIINASKLGIKNENIQSLLREGISLKKEQKNTTSSTPLTNKSLSTTPSIQDRTPYFKLSSGALGTTTAGITAGALALGVPTATYARFRQNYRNNFEQSAKMVADIAPSVKVADIPSDKTHITFSIGGFSGDSSGGERLLKNLAATKGLGGHYFESISNEDFDVSPSIKQNDGIAFTKSALSELLQTSVQEGRNPVAIKIATRAYAYKQKYPSSTISLVGHSAGGIASHEAAEILDKLGVETQVLAIGSPYFGLTEPTKKSMTIVSNKDGIVTAGNVMNGNWINSVKGHQIPDYFADDKAKETIASFLGGSKEKERTDTRRCLYLSKESLGDFVAPSRNLSKFVKPSSQPLVTKHLAPPGEVRPESLSGGVSPRQHSMSTKDLSTPTNNTNTRSDFSPKPNLLPTDNPKHGLTNLDKLLVTPANSLSNTNIFLKSRRIIRVDKNKRAKSRCKVGKICGSVCIPKKNICQEKKQNKKVGNTIEKSITKVPSKHSPYAESAGIAITSGAGLMGVSVATYMNARENYRKGIPQSAQLAKKQSKEVEVPEIGKDKQQVTFTVGGFYSGFGEKEARKGEDYFTHKMKTEVLDDKHFVETHRNLEFNIAPDPILSTVNWEKPENVSIPTAIDAGVRVVVGHYQKTLEPVFKTGRNPEAVKLAAKVYAYKQKYPDKDINLCGHSAGGMITHETAEILKEMGITAKTVNLGTSWYGFTKKVGESYTIADKEDFYLKSMGIPRDPIYLGDGSKLPSMSAHTLKHYMRSKEVQAKLKELLNKSKADLRYDNSEIELKNLTKDVSTRRTTKFLLQLKEILDRVYSDKIDSFLKVDVDDTGNIAGVFRDRTKLIDFTIKSDKIEYKLRQSKLDSYEYGYALTSSRFDARKGKSKGKDKCVGGISCGEACVAPGKTCRIASNKIASSSELSELRLSATKLKTPQQSKRKPSDGLEESSIRDLKKKASDIGVYRYSELTKEQLVKSIRTVKESPEQENRLRETFEKRASARKLVAGTDLGKLVKKWDQVGRIVKISGAAPELATGAIAAFVAGVTVSTYNNLRDQYRDGLEDSATAATIRAEKMPTNYIRKPNITFAVGGFKGSGSSGTGIRDELHSRAEIDGAATRDRWFRDDNDIITFESTNFDIDPAGVSKKNSDGSYNPAYLGHVAFNGFGSMVRNLQGKRNEDSVELAAQIYAYANRKGGTNNNSFVHKDKPINVLAHSSGGLTSREAMEIVARMPNGKEVLKRVNLVTLGTPDFGFMEKGLVREMTISSGQDPFSILPKRYEKMINAVKGHEIEDYLSNKEVLEQVRRQFNYYSGTTYYQEVEKKRRRGTKKTTTTKKTTAKTKVSPPPASPTPPSTSEGYLRQI